MRYAHSHVTHISSKKAETEQVARLFESHKDQRREANDRTTEKKGPHTARALAHRTTPMLPKRGKIGRKAFPKRNESIFFSRGSFFSVAYYSQRHTETQGGVIVPKSIAKSAVVRNRIKRAIYSAMREATPRLNRPIRIVITAMKGAEKLTAKEAKDELFASITLMQQRKT